MNTKNEKIEMSVVENLQNLASEVDSRSAVIQALIKSDIDLESSVFKKYQEEYKKAFLAYETAKKEFENNYVKPTETGAKRWDLNFNTGVLTVEF